MAELSGVERSPDHPKRSGGITRFINRLPVLLFRWRLNWLFGQRLLMLTHRGRRTGHLHQTVLEAIGRHATAGEYVVVAAHGPVCDWYRNLQAGPAVAVQVGRTRFIPAQRFLTPDEASAVLADQARRQPRYARFYRRTLLRRLGHDASDPAEQRRLLAAALPMVAFRPAPSHARPAVSDSQA